MSTEALTLLKRYTWEVYENAVNKTTELGTFVYGNGNERAMVCAGCTLIAGGTAWSVYQAMQQRRERIKEIDVELKKLNEKIGNENHRLAERGKQDFRHERNNENVKVLVCIGKTGFGKSVFCNRMLGDISINGANGKKITLESKDRKEKHLLFKINDGVHSCSNKIEKFGPCVLNESNNINGYIDDGEEIEKTIMVHKSNRSRIFSIVDTPGASGTNGIDNDITNFNELGQVFGECGGINMFCVVKQATNFRVDNEFVELLKKYQRFYSNDHEKHNDNNNEHKAQLQDEKESKESKMNGYDESDFWDHVVIIMTRCDKDSEEVELFKKNKLSLEVKLKKELGIDDNKQLKIFAIGKNNYNKTRKEILNLLFNDPNSIFCHRFISPSIDTPIVQWQRDKAKLEAERERLINGCG